jgi:hypothetical protein
VQVFLQIHEAFEQASGLDRLKAGTRRASSPADEAELTGRSEAACAASLFAFHAYLAARLRTTSAIRPSRSPSSAGARERAALGQARALHAALHYLCARSTSTLATTPRW